MQRINATSKGDLRKKRLGAWHGHRPEVIREYPRPVGNEVIPSESHIRITAGHHLGEIAMHDTETTGKTPYLGGKEGVGCRFPEQRLGGGAALGTNIACIG